jgi:ribonucleoside-diphosphate reductase alpha chain
MRIDKKKDALLEDYAIGMLKDFYLQDGEKSPQEGFLRAAKAWSTYKEVMDEDLAERLYGYVSNKWFMYASPVLSNAPVRKRRQCLSHVSLPMYPTH